MLHCGILDGLGAVGVQKQRSVRPTQPQSGFFHQFRRKTAPAHLQKRWQLSNLTNRVQEKTRTTRFKGPARSHQAPAHAQDRLRRALRRLHRAQLSMDKLHHAMMSTAAVAIGVAASLSGNGGASSGWWWKRQRQWSTPVHTLWPFFGNAACRQQSSSRSKR